MLDVCICILEHAEEHFVSAHVAKVLEVVEKGEGASEYVSHDSVEWPLSIFFFKEKVVSVINDELLASMGVLTKLSCHFVRRLYAIGEDINPFILIGSKSIITISV